MRESLDCETAMILDTLILTVYVGPPLSLPCWLTLLCHLSLTSASPITGQGVLFRNSDSGGARGAVASESSICSKIGIDTIAIGVRLLLLLVTFHSPKTS